MDKKLIFKTGRYAQIYTVFIIWGLVIGQSFRQVARVGLLPMMYPLVAIWFIFFIVAVSKRTFIEVTEKGIAKKTKRKILWEVDWIDIEELSYSKMKFIRILTFSFTDGNLIISHNRSDLQSKTFIKILHKGKFVLYVNLFPKDIKK